MQLLAIKFTNPFAIYPLLTIFIGVVLVLLFINIVVKNVIFYRSVKRSPRLARLFVPIPSYTLKSMDNKKSKPAFGLNRAIWLFYVALSIAVVMLFIMAL